MSMTPRWCGGGHRWLRLLSSVGCIVILLRNLLVSFYELMLDRWAGGQLPTTAAPARASPCGRSLSGVCVVWMSLQCGGLPAAQPGHAQPAGEPRCCDMPVTAPW